MEPSRQTTSAIVEPIWRLSRVLDSDFLFASLRLAECGEEATIHAATPSSPDRLATLGGKSIAVSQIRSRIQELFYATSTQDWIAIGPGKICQTRIQVLASVSRSTAEVLLLKVAGGSFSDYQYYALLTSRRIPAASHGSTLSEIALLLAGNAARCIQDAAGKHPPELGEPTLAQTLSRRLLTDEVRTWKKTLNANLFEGISPRTAKPSDFILTDLALAHLVMGI